MFNVQSQKQQQQPGTWAHASLDWHNQVLHNGCATHTSGQVHLNDPCSPNTWPVGGYFLFSVSALVTANTPPMPTIRSIVPGPSATLSFHLLHTRTAHLPLPVLLVLDDVEQLRVHLLQGGVERLGPLRTPQPPVFRCATPQPPRPRCVSDCQTGHTPRAIGRRLHGAASARS